MFCYFKFFRFVFNIFISFRIRCFTHWKRAVHKWQPLEHTRAAVSRFYTGKKRPTITAASAWYSILLCLSVHLHPTHVSKFEWTSRTLHDNITYISCNAYTLFVRKIRAVVCTMYASNNATRADYIILNIVILLYNICIAHDAADVDTVQYPLRIRLEYVNATHVFYIILYFAESCA